MPKKEPGGKSFFEPQTCLNCTWTSELEGFTCLSPAYQDPPGLNSKEHWWYTNTGKSLGAA